MRFRGVNRRGARDQAKKPVPLDQRFAALFQAGDSWFDADSVATSGGKVVSFVDRRDATHLLTQANPTYQVSTPAASAAFNNKSTAAFSNAFYLSNRPTSSWVFLHGLSEVYTVTKYNYAGLGVFLETWNAGNGYQLYTANPGDAAFTIYRPTTGEGLTVTGLSGASPAVTHTVIEATQASIKITGKTEQSRAVTGTAAAAGKPLALGARGAGSVPWVGELRSMYIFQRVLTAAERATVEAYIVADCGVVL